MTNRLATHTLQDCELCQKFGLQPLSQQTSTLSHSKMRYIHPPPKKKKQGGAIIFSVHQRIRSVHLGEDIATEARKSGKYEYFTH